MKKIICKNCSVEYVFCEKKGKAFALNTGLSMGSTPYFSTVDADTYLEKKRSTKNYEPYCFM